MISDEELLCITIPAQGGSVYCPSRGGGGRSGFKRPIRILAKLSKRFSFLVNIFDFEFFSVFNSHMLMTGRDLFSNRVSNAGRMIIWFWATLFIPLWWSLPVSRQDWRWMLGPGSAMEGRWNYLMPLQYKPFTSSAYIKFLVLTRLFDSLSWDI